MTIFINYTLLILSLFFLGSGYYIRSKGHNRSSVDHLKIHNHDGRDKSFGEKRSIKKTGTTVSFNPLKLSAIGWFLLGVYWLLLVPEYLEDFDIFNVILCGGALPFFSYIGYIEWSSANTEIKCPTYEKKEMNDTPGPSAGTRPEKDPQYGANLTYGGYEGLRFLSGITVISLAGYTIISGVPIVEGSMEYVNAYLVSAFLTLFGYPAEAGGIDYSGNPLWFRNNDLFISVPILHNGQNDVHITLSCTAFPSMLLFTSAIIGANESVRIKMKTFLLTVPVIFVLNILRMSIIVYLTYTGTTSADFAHHVVGKTGSLFALLFLAWVLFTFLPSILDNIEEVYNVLLPKDHRDELK